MFGMGKEFLMSFYAPILVPLVFIFLIAAGVMFCSVFGCNRNAKRKEV